MRKKALIVEDDPDVRQVVAEQLALIDFESDTAADGVTGSKMAIDEHYDLLVLDLNLPRLEGVEVCKQVREHKKNMPIIILSTRDDEMSKVLLLELGADDYVSKPFSAAEFKARVKAVLRRTENQADVEGESGKENFTFKDLSIDFIRRRVSLNGAAVDLTAREFDLLAKLVSDPGRPFSREELNQELYGYDISAYEKSINSYINRIRAKLEPNAAEPIYILTVRGVGYCFSDGS